MKDHSLSSVGTTMNLSYILDYWKLCRYNRIVFSNMVTGVQMVELLGRVR
jgi:hypothetical protein